jgi:von Willebrand factor type A domain
MANRMESPEPGSGLPSQPAGQTVSRSISSAPLVKLGDGVFVIADAGTAGAMKQSLADICIVFDTTGSMSDKIKGLISCMTEFVDQLSSLSLDWRITVVPFGDLTVPGDRIDLDLPFVRTAEEAKIQLQTMPRFSGGDNVGESSIEAVLGAAEKPWRKGAVRIAMLLTDEPAVGIHWGQDVLGKLRSSEIILFVASPDYDYYKSWAVGTGGQWMKIGPSMDTGVALDLLRSLVKKIALVAAKVHEIAGGSVAKYLEITGGDQSQENR